MESSTITTQKLGNTAAEEQGVVFHSEASNYRIVREPSRRKQIGEGSDFEIRDGKIYQFYDGVLRVTDSDDIEWLRDYESNGRYYFEVDDPNRRATETAALQTEVMEKALEGDFDRIADILVAERHALSRPEIITACTAALNAGDQDQPEPPQTPLHEIQRVRTGPTAGVTPGVSPDPQSGEAQVDPSTLQSAPGAPVGPTEESAVPPGQAPASEVAEQGKNPEEPSATTPSAKGPLTTPEEIEAVGTALQQEREVNELGEPGAPAVPDENDTDEKAEN